MLVDIGTPPPSQLSGVKLAVMLTLPLVAHESSCIQPGVLILIVKFAPTSKRNGKIADVVSS